MTHADISSDASRITSLCGLKGGKFVYQELFLIEYDGKVSCDVTCERCKTTALMIGNGHSLSKARAIAREQSK